jgi:hypothetical protein
MRRNNQTVRVSHIGSSENLNGETQVGTILINFLVMMKVDPNANVALLIDDNGNKVLESLYSFDLYDSISRISHDLILTSVNFEGPDDKRDSLLRLVEFLEGIQNKSYDDNNIYEKALFELERMPPVEIREVITEVRSGPKNHLVAPSRTIEVVQEEILSPPLSPPPRRRVGFDNNPQAFTPSDTHRSPGQRRTEVVVEKKQFFSPGSLKGSLRGSGYNY